MGNKRTTADHGKPGLAPRRAALALVQAVLAEGAMLSEALPALGALEPAARARAQALATATLRHLARADAVLAPHLRKAPPLKVQNVLRLAVVEMAEDAVPPHAAVDAAVSLLRADRRTAHLAGLANAVLRRASEGLAARWAGLPPGHLPPWLRRPLVAAWGRPATDAMEAAHAAGAALDLTPREPREAAALAAALAAEVLPTGSLRRRAPAQVSELPGFAEGAWWVQDAAAALPARLFGPLAGARALDLCAAPGGKTMQLAAAGAEVTALDISGPRLARLRDNLSRTGLAATLVTADALAWAPEGRFDAILLDAPCSATGTIRRHPDLPHLRSAEDLPALVALQAALIDRALGWLAPGGSLVYCTCSLLPDEGEAQLDAALARHPALRVAAPDAAALGLDPGWVTAAGGLRLRPDYWPGRGGMDGFFIARLTLG